MGNSRNKKPDKIRIHGGRVIDPANNIDASQDVYIANGRIAALGKAPDGFKADHEIDATGCIVCPGLVDLSARVREPGMERKATIASSSRYCLPILIPMSLQISSVISI